MARLLRGKIPRFVLVIYTVLAVMGTLSFAALEPLRSVTFEVENQGRLSASLENCSVQPPGEEQAFISRTSDSSFSPLRTGFQRFTFLSGSPRIENAFSKSSFFPGAEAHHIALRNTILLKLRI
jgi:hypothetical protein